MKTWVACIVLMFAVVASAAQVRYPAKILSVKRFPPVVMTKQAGALVYGSRAFAASKVKDRGVLIASINGKTCASVPGLGPQPGNYFWGGINDDLDGVLSRLDVLSVKGETIGLRSDQDWDTTKECLPFIIEVRAKMYQVGGWFLSEAEAGFLANEPPQGAGTGRLLTPVEYGEICQALRMAEHAARRRRSGGVSYGSAESMWAGIQASLLQAGSAEEQAARERAHVQECVALMRSLKAALLRGVDIRAAMASGKGLD